MGCPKFFKFHPEATIEQYCNRFGYDQKTLTETIVYCAQNRDKGYAHSGEKGLIESLKEMDFLEITDTLYEKVRKKELGNLRDVPESSMEPERYVVVLEEGFDESSGNPKDLSRSPNDEKYALNGLNKYEKLIEGLYRSIVSLQSLSYISAIDSLLEGEPSILNKGSLLDGDQERSFSRLGGFRAMDSSRKMFGFNLLNVQEIIPGIAAKKDEYGFVIYFVIEIGNGRLFVIGSRDLA